MGPKYFATLLSTQTV